MSKREKLLEGLKQQGFCIVNNKGEMHWTHGFEEYCIATDKNDLLDTLEDCKDQEPEKGWDIEPFYTATPKDEGFDQFNTKGFKYDDQ